ncbi:MAG: hypothetical protein R3B99_25145 [Polyangiales bacterium]
MSRWLLSFLLAASTLASTASAQVAGRRPVAAGDVSGVELQLEGSLSVERGSTLRWAVVAYEVVGLDRLRPAPGAEIRLATSLRRRSDDDAGPLVVTADARGRAVIELPIPNDAPDSIGATLDVHARRGVTRRFELRVQTREPRQLVLFGAENAPAPGRLPVFGRLSTTTAGVADAEIKLVLNDGRGPLGVPVRVRTDAAGLFSHEFRVPREAEGALRVDATGPSDGSDAERRPRAAWAATIAQPSEPPLVVAVRPTRSLVRSQERVEVEVLASRRRTTGSPRRGFASAADRSRSCSKKSSARRALRGHGRRPRAAHGKRARRRHPRGPDDHGAGGARGHRSWRRASVGARQRSPPRVAPRGRRRGARARALGAGLRARDHDGWASGRRRGRWWSKDRASVGPKAWTTEGGVVAVDLRVGAPRGRGSLRRGWPRRTSW